MTEVKAASKLTLSDGTHITVMQSVDEVIKAVDDALYFEDKLITFDKHINTLKGNGHEVESLGPVTVKADAIIMIRPRQMYGNHVIEPKEDKG